MKKKVPSVDLVDILEETNTSDAKKKQFAPQYSQDAYETII